MVGRSGPGKAGADQAWIGVPYPVGVVQTAQAKAGSSPAVRPPAPFWLSDESEE